MNKKITYNDFNPSIPALQLLMNFNVDTMIPEDGKVRLVCNIVERMNLNSVLSTYSLKGRKPVLDPITFLKVILFCYSEGIFRSRKIEDFCRYDIRGRFILGQGKAPDHSTICRFENMLTKHDAELLTEFVKLLIEDKHVDLKTLYIDGTKIESSANRYTFVWRKSVEKNWKKLNEKIICEMKLPEDSSSEKVEKSARRRFNEIRSICRNKKIEFVHGIGRRKTQEQREYEHLAEVLERIAKYKLHLRIMGDRNSYSKTDHDATFMRMKEDHMLNGQLKPGYNIQMASSGAFIVGVMGSQKANDLHTLKPFLKQLQSSYGTSIGSIVADAGYESVENYDYLEKENLTAYIKPANYELKKKRKNRNDIGRKENMTYLEERDVYVCKSGKHLVRGKDQQKKTASGFKDTIRVYTCNECVNCQYAQECIKPRRNVNPTRKNIMFSPAFERYRAESEANILTAEGINHRINRSIQAEGAFSKLKDGLNYKRFRHRTMNKVVSDLTLVAVALNINKLHSKILNNQTEIIDYKKTA